MEQLFNNGDKVIPINKTSRDRELHFSASYYKMVEMNQNHLYVNAIDNEMTEKLGEICYWCDAVQGMGDSYRQSDLIKYIESKEELFSNLEKNVENAMIIAVNNFITNVFAIYKSEYDLRFAKYEKLNEEDTMKELFNASTFYSLMNDNPNYVMEYNPSYWAFHIVREIENTIDFDKLKQVV